MDETQADSKYVPFGSRTAIAESHSPTSRNATTKSSFLMAVLPLVALIVDIFIFSLNGQETTWTNLVAVTVATLALSSWLAVCDQRRLKELGVVVPTSPLVALICPIAYLFARGSRAWRETASGLTAAWLNVLVLLVVCGLLYELPVVIAALNALGSATP